MNKASRIFTIKVFGPQSLVLVESKGLDAEIFMPQISNGRIVLQNVVNERRCCSKSIPQSKEQHNLQKTATNFQLPLANSTPSACRSLQNSTLPTPEPVRRAVLAQNESFHNMQPLRETNHLKIVKLHRNPNSSTPQKLAKIVPMMTISPVRRKSNKENSRPSIGIISDIRLSSLEIPQFSTTEQPSISNIISTPQQASSIRSPVVRTATKWRKCLTPAKTYSRRANLSNPNIRKCIRIRTPMRTPRHRNGRRNEAWNFNPNPTKGVPSDPPIDIKISKTKIDQETKISPESFKSQLLDTSDLGRKEHHMPRTKLQLYHHQFSAFDLITTPCNNKCIAGALRDQFRKKCLVRRNTNDPKYNKLLADIPPLESNVWQKEREEVLMRKKLEFANV